MHGTRAGRRCDPLAPLGPGLPESRYATSWRRTADRRPDGGGGLKPALGMRGARVAAGGGAAGLRRIREAPWRGQPPRDCMRRDPRCPGRCGAGRSLWEDRESSLPGPPHRGNQTLDDRRLRCACPSAAPLLSLRRGRGDGQSPGDVDAEDGRFETGVPMPGDGAERKARQWPVRRAAVPSVMGCCAVEGDDRRDRGRGCPMARNAAGCGSERSGRG